MAVITVIAVLAALVFLGMLVGSVGGVCLRMAVEIGVGLSGLSLSMAVGEWMAILFALTALAYSIYRSTICAK